MTPHETFDCDAIIVGGGFAGVIACRDLSDAGLSVILVEARDRLGGRTWTRRFADTDLMVEIGGAYVSPDTQPQLHAELTRYGLTVDQAPAAQSTLLVDGATRHTGALPVPADEIYDLERAAYHFIRDGRRIDPSVPLDRQQLADLDIPFSEYLARLELPERTHAFLSNWPALYMARYAPDSSALYLLSWLPQFGHSLLKLWSKFAIRITGGTVTLIDAIAADSRATIHLRTPVTQISQDGAGAAVRTEDGRTLSARHIILTTPLSAWNDIAFEPPLGAAKREASAARHVAYARKFWALVRNAPPCPAVLALAESTDGATFLYTEMDLGDAGQLMVGGLVVDPADPDAAFAADLSGIEKYVTTLLPGAEVVKADTHDWVTDPYSGEGAFSAFGPGCLSRSHSLLSAPEGRLHFASADIAVGFPASIEGAIDQGHTAALEVRRQIDREQRSGGLSAQSP